MRRRERDLLLRRCGCGLALCYLAVLASRKWNRVSSSPITVSCGAACPTNITLASSCSSDELESLRRCAEARYRCGAASLVFVHTHKGGGTSFVDMARANDAGLAKRERNGDPIKRAAWWRPAKSGLRREWWRLKPSKQAKWFDRMRSKRGTRFISTEKGFPRYETHLLAPQRVVYAIVVRDPVQRMVSFYFWKYRDKSIQRQAAALFVDFETATVRSGAPSFGGFLEKTYSDGYYVRRLLGETEEFELTPEALQRAQRVLTEVFSLVLVTSRLKELGPLVERTLGWTRSHFDEFHSKHNPAPDVAILRAWRPDWREELRKNMPMDVQVHAHAMQLSDDRLATLLPSETTTRLRKKRS